MLVPACLDCFRSESASAGQRSRASTDAENGPPLLVHLSSIPSPSLRRCLYRAYVLYADFLPQLNRFQMFDSPCSVHPLVSPLKEIPLRPVRETFICMISYSYCSLQGSTVPGHVLLSYPVLCGSAPSVPFVAHYRACVAIERARQMCASDFALVAVQAPLSMAFHSPRRELVRIAAQHSVTVSRAARTPSGLLALLREHECNSKCSSACFVFRTAVTTVSSRRGAGDANAVPSAAFPPSVLGVTERADIVREWCKATSGAVMHERACAVCARLTRLPYLSRIEIRSVDLAPLDRSGEGVTRAERTSAADPVEELPGPVLFEEAVEDQDGVRFMHACRSCLSGLRRHELPRHALANGRWVGAVPAVLQNLTYVEQLMIARYRHSFCVAQVTLGQRYLAANVIVFGQPVARAYKFLPPPRSEIEEILAILFVGSVSPTEADFRRTPFLMRHRVVVQCVDWLRYNSVSYSDVEISMENLQQYPKDAPPVAVVFRKSAELSATANPAVNAGEPNLGVGSGECAFIVHSLTGEDMADMTYDAKVARAIRYFDGGGEALAYGHDTRPESIYHNPKLFPGMFPWLYPYGLGGFGNRKMAKELDHAKHVRANLLHADRRFQTNRCYPFIVFNHRQIRSSGHGGYLLTQRGYFDSVADKIMNIDRAALDSIIDRASSGEYVKPITAAEKACFDLIHVVDRVAGHVEGSATQKKYQRNEIRSLIYVKGVPVFFLTFAPVDFKHPLCLYLCGERVDLDSYSPLLRNSDDRLRAIARNPVGAARFFDIMVKTFLKHVLRVDGKRAGLLGTTDAYYGTVESQGRLTLHLHLLVWLLGSLSPQVIRDRILADEHFEAGVIDWLEGCHQGQFSVLTEESLADELEEQYTEYRFGEPVMKTRIKRGVRDPATVLPSPPPPAMTSEEADNWYNDLLCEADRVAFVSNRHDKNHDKGCMRGTPASCRARFPREIVQSTEVDRESGALRFRHLSPWVNTFHPLLSFVLRCNHDVTCLLSGTKVKAVLGYVTDYVTKTKLSTDSFFSTVRSVLDRHSDALVSSGADNEDAARSLIVKVVNALTASAETGGPAVCAHLLGQPDHYTDHTFQVFYWYPYVRHAKETSPATDPDDEPDSAEERVLLGRTADGVVQLNKVFDYTCRPGTYKRMSLYEYLRSMDIRKVPSREKMPADDDAFIDDECVSDNGSEDDVDGEASDGDEPHHEDCAPAGVGHRFGAGHPLRATHAAYQRAEPKKPVLNFVGGALPRPDRGDREQYCFTMLVFFAPDGWRTGSDLKLTHENWTSAFERTAFHPDHVGIMRNMNLLYECLDARDDYAAIRRRDAAVASLSIGPIDAASLDELPRELSGLDDLPYDHTEDSLASLLDDSPIGPITSRIRREMDDIRDVFGGQRAPENLVYETSLVTSSPFAIRSPAQWKGLVQGVRQIVLDRMRARPDMLTDGPWSGFPPDVFPFRVPQVKIVTLEELDTLRRHSIDISRGPQDPHIQLLTGVIDEFTLNSEQARAFCIAAKHLHHRFVEPLRMYLGGMAGTGKSRVLKALMKFLKDRGEGYRFIVLGPTGASASLVGGSTYHSALGFKVTRGTEETTSLTSLERVCGRLELVDLIFLDEVSMISCSDICRISTQLNKAFGDPTTCFGGKSVILAGDFAQLAPAGRSPALYSDRVGAWLASSNLSSQRSAIGKAVWHQFTTVVLLRQNMRQRGLSDEDKRFRIALENMRYCRCTQADVMLIMSRVCRPELGSTARKAPRFHDVSVITAFNSHRDAINEVGVREFAAHRGLPLFRFHSIDKWGAKQSVASIRQTQVAYDKTVDPVRTTNVVSPRLQRVLWELPSSCTGHHAGVLELCKGMPVMLKYNEATELSATNGAEAEVVDWVSHLDRGHLVLDTLFVRLTDPANTVQIEGLEPNVIPLARSKKSVCCVLPISDKNVYIQRDQVMVLPNFAMTDFASQGRTRPNNVVHPRYCKSHQSLYTCLSRSSTLSGTLLIDSFNPSRIRGGAGRALRKEYRELELLDHVTRLSTEGSLPESVHGLTRGVLLQSYILWKGKRYVPPLVPPELNWAQAPASDLVLSASGGPPDQPTAVVQPSSKRKRTDGQWTTRNYKRSNPLAQPDQSAYAIDDSLPPPTLPVTPSGRLGLVWDAVDYSCAYDAVLTVLWNFYADTGNGWLSVIAPGNNLFDFVRAKFPTVYTAPEQLEAARDEIRDVLQLIDPVAFPRRGTAGIVLSEMLRLLLMSPAAFGHCGIPCASCGTYVRYVPDIISSYFWTVSPHWWQETFGEMPSTDAQSCASALLNTRHILACTACAAPSSLPSTLLTAPPLLVIETGPVNTVIPTERISLPVAGGLAVWQLRAAIYFGFHHYTSRFIDPAGTVWYHDGASTARYCIREPTPRSLDWYRHARSRPASHYIYALIDSGLR